MNDQFIILTATYNKCEYLSDWSKSILQQKYRPLSVTVVDDASTDGYTEELKKLVPVFVEAGIGLQMISNQKRLYCGSSYKLALSKSPGGSFYGVLDADDMLVDGAVEYIANMYKKYEEITYIYTQFMICDIRMKPKKVGISAAPDRSTNMLAAGITKHYFSHWRTFSSRLNPSNKPDNYLKIFPDEMRSAVDKFMGYRLEELGKGMFVDKVCYLYREGVKGAVTQYSKNKEAWKAVVKDAIKRRKRYVLRPHEVVVAHE